MPYYITLCAGDPCPIKQFCHRYTTEIYGRQDFFSSLPFDISTKTCSCFLRNEAYFEHIRLKAYELWQKSEKPIQNANHYWQLAEEAFFMDL
jgi:hypothetical protein